MDTIDERKAIVQQIALSDTQKDIKLDILRLDLIHPVISGNKWYKLKKNLDYAVRNGFEGVLTFGGAHSNHLIATAHAAKLSGLQSVGVIRGMYHELQLTDTLLQCISEGMQLHYVSKENYNKKEEPEWLEFLLKSYPGMYVIPEGGANALGREGAEDIVRIIDREYTAVCCAVGTGTTFIGLRNALSQSIKMLGFVPMKGGKYLEEEVGKYTGAGGWRLFDEWHFGGFGKWNKELVKFMNDFYSKHTVPLDIVYTSKMMYGVQALMSENYFPPHSRILCVHSGGLQGNASVQHELIY